MTRSANYMHNPTIKQIVLNIPHSSIEFPSQEDLMTWPQEIRIYIDRWTDWFTDIIFDSIDPRVVPVVFPYSRFYCDVERLIDDPLESTGQGIFYECFDGIPRRWRTENRINAMKWYHRHIDILSEAITDPNTLLIDCHSFPKDLSDIEICIGLNNDWSRPSQEFVDYVVAYFRQEGYYTEINVPYSNSISPPKEFKYTSLMIEVNKGVYLNAKNKLDPPKEKRLKHTINNLYDYLLSD